MRCFTYYVVTGNTRQAVGIKWRRRNEHLDSWNAIVRMRDEFIFREGICFHFQLCRLFQCSLFVSKEQSWHATKCKCSKCCYFSHSHSHLLFWRRLLFQTFFPAITLLNRVSYCYIKMDSRGWQECKEHRCSTSCWDGVCVHTGVRVCVSTNLYIVEFFYYPWSQAWVSIRIGDVQMLNHTKTHSFNNLIRPASLNIPI